MVESIFNIDFMPIRGYFFSRVLRRRNIMEIITTITTNTLQTHPDMTNGLESEKDFSGFESSNIVGEDVCNLLRCEMVLNKE